MFFVFFIFFGLVLGLLAVNLGTVAYYSRVTMDRKVLPMRRFTANTQRDTTAAPKFCPRCGKEYGDHVFCTVCGSAKRKTYVYHIPMNKFMRARDLENAVNEWLAENPYATNCKLRLETSNMLFCPLIPYVFLVKSASIEYVLDDKPQNVQYGMAFLYKFRLFGSIGYSEEKHVAEWRMANPDCAVLSTRGGHIQHWDSNGGFYAQYYNYILFAKKLG